MPENCSIGIIKRKIAKQFNVDKNGLFVCDIWRSNVHREFRNSSGDHVGDINRKNDDIFVYYSAPNTQYDDRKVLPQFQTFAITFEKTVERELYYYNQPPTEDVMMGYPILITFDLNISITIKEVGDRILQLIKPFVPHININDYWNNYNNNNNDNIEKPFIMQAKHSFNHVVELTDSGQVFNLSEKNLQFVVHFNDPEQYHNDRYDYSTRLRDSSAPVKINRSHRGQLIEAYEYRSAASIDLDECIDMVSSSAQKRLAQHNLWYCKKCKHFQCMKKNLQSWNSSDLLIIRLDRYNNGVDDQKLNYIDMLIKFQINQGLVLTGENQDVLYELYAIKNYGVEDAHVKSVFNQKWYHMEDNNHKAASVNNVNHMISENAHTLFYIKK